jgi:putative Ca2+/H+ antiporter (TMEM165/GDT1 family)
LDVSWELLQASEIGDKTFLIAAILAMRQSKIVVLSGALLSLVVMSILSALLGVMFPSLLPKSVTNLLAAGLFLIFGLKMLRDGSRMTGDEIKEEWEEAEREIEEEEGGHELSELEQGENNHANGSAKTPTQHGATHTLREGAKNLCGLCFSPVFAQAFILTFLGEWGDRSQIATIALAAAHNVTLVCLGTIVGHAICTSLAVVCGSWLATKISVKHVTLGGAALFLLFALIYAYEAYVEPGSLSAEDVVKLSKEAVEAIHEIGASGGAAATQA